MALLPPRNSSIGNSSMGCLRVMGVEEGAWLKTRREVVVLRINDLPAPIASFCHRQTGSNTGLFISHVIRERDQRLSRH